ncbi:MAG: hypothetical protein ACI8P3_002365 [Saprospiraceae bacterium]|jgi:hypothetical protein
MKNYSIVMLAFLFVLSIGLSSCAKKGCGGWYGKRNLGYVPAKKISTDSVSPIMLNDEDSECEISNP